MTSRRAYVVDTSAAVAVLTDQDGHESIIDTLANAEQRLMSAASYVELGIVLEARLGPAATGAARRFVRDAEITLVEVDSNLAERAVEAWRRFGKGRHAAALNFGDCFTYALAAELDLAVICVGEDFARTDIEVFPGRPAQ